MYTDLETATLYFFYELGRDFISLRHEVKRRAKSKFLLNIHQLAAPVMALLGIDVMGEYQCELVPIRPSLPTSRWITCFRIDGPDVASLFILMRCDPTPEKYLKSSRDDRLTDIEQSVNGVHRMNVEFSAVIEPVRVGMSIGSTHMAIQKISGQTQYRQRHDFNKRVGGFGNCNVYNETIFYQIVFVVGQLLLDGSP